MDVWRLFCEIAENFFATFLHGEKGINQGALNHLLGVCSLVSSRSEMQRKPKRQEPVGDDVASRHLFPSADMRSLRALTGTCMENVREEKSELKSSACSLRAINGGH